MTAPEAPLQQVRNEERLYLQARLLVCATLAAISLLPLAFPGGSDELWMYYFLLAMFVVVTGYVGVRLRRGPGEVRASLMWLLAPDVVVIAGFTYLFAPMADGFYPVVIAMPLTYSVLLGRRQAMIASAAFAAAYVVGHGLDGKGTVTELALLVVATGAIVLITMLVSVSVDQRRRREADASLAVAERRVVNEQLERRIAELQAIREITDTIHARLDFDNVGPDIISILGKVLGVEACTLLVLDREDSTTLFSATLGPAVETAPAPPLVPGTAVATDEHFSCLSVLDHPHASVMFCAPSGQIDELTEEDRTVLIAVANELVVAVENSRLYQLTARLAITDELTDLFNYRYLQNRLDDEIERARRYDKRLSLLMIDADDFKGYNDEYGHMAGDRALGELAQVLRSVVREVDLVARYGGEEFSIVLPETDAAGAYVVAEKVREAVANHQMRDGDEVRTRYLTVSIGLATFPTHAWDKEALLKEADDALYQAKDGGKNRVRTPRRKSAAPPRDSSVEPTADA